MFFFDFCGTYINSCHLPWQKRSMYLSRTNTWKAFNDGGNTPTWPSFVSLRCPLCRGRVGGIFQIFVSTVSETVTTVPPPSTKTGTEVPWTCELPPQVSQEMLWKMMITGNTFLSYWVSGTFFGRRFLLNFGRVSNFDQLIQALTFLSPSWRSPTTFERVQEPSQKGHKDLPGTCSFLFIFVESIDQFHIAARRFCLMSLTLQYTKLDGSAPKRIFLVLGFILQSTRPTKGCEGLPFYELCIFGWCSVDEQMSNRWPCSLLNDKQMSTRLWIGVWVERLPDIFWCLISCTCQKSFTYPGAIWQRLNSNETLTNLDFGDKQGDIRSIIQYTLP